MAPRRVAVLGAGLAGLRAALYLVEHGCEVELFERHQEPGGMARSHNVDGYVFDHGPHGFFSRDEWIMEEFKDLIESEGGARWLTKWSQIHYREHYFNFPLRITDLISKMSPFTVVAAGFSYLLARLRVKLRGREARNAEEYLVDEFGRVLYDAFFGPFTRKVWNIDPRELDADFTRDRVPSLHLWDVVRKLFRDPAKEQYRVGPSGRVVTHDVHTFFYPRRGARALPLAYARRITAAGGRLHTNVTLERVDLGRKTVSGRSDGEPFSGSYDGVVSTIPLDSLVGLLAPAPPAEIREIARGLRYRGILLVNLCLAKPKVIGPFWIYFTKRFFNRISEYKQFSPDLVPEGKTGICCEVGANPGDDLWNAPDQEIVDRCMVDLTALDLVRADEVEAFQIIREANAYPIYDVGYRARINRLVAWIEQEARIVTAGRQGRFLYINQDAAIKSGFEAGEAMTELLETGTLAHRRVWEEPAARRKIVV